jgi:hypothetical protein
VSTFFPQFKTDCWHPLSILLTYGSNCLPLSYFNHEVDGEALENLALKEHWKAGTVSMI